VAVDMRGYGDSDKPAALEEYKMVHLVNDIKEIIEALGMYMFVVVVIQTKI
jgi:pimeloyl-ACP methyl ester carboxylesterase